MIDSRTEFARKYGTWAVITGGSEGVGAEWARACAERGLNLVLLARRADVLEQTATEMRAKGVDVVTLAVDITAPDLIEQLSDVTAGLEVGLLIHNVGSWERDHGWFLDDPLEVSIKTVEVNCLAPIHLVHMFGPAMCDRGRGAIVLVGSLAGIAGQPLEATYSAAKAFSQHFAEALWSELREHGVEVVSVPLGGTRTPALEAKGLVAVDGLPTAAQVVDESIERLADGPVFVPVEANRKFFDTVSALPRREATEKMARLAYRSMGRPVKSQAAARGGK